MSFHYSMDNDLTSYLNYYSFKLFNFNFVVDTFLASLFGLNIQVIKLCKLYVDNHLPQNYYQDSSQTFDKEFNVIIIDNKDFLLTFIILNKLYKMLLFNNLINFYTYRIKI